MLLVLHDPMIDLLKIPKISRKIYLSVIVPVNGYKNSPFHILFIVLGSAVKGE